MHARLCLRSATEYCSAIEFLALGCTPVYYRNPSLVCQALSGCNYFSSSSTTGVALNFCYLSFHLAFFSAIITSLSVYSYLGLLFSFPPLLASASRGSSLMSTNTQMLSSRTPLAIPTTVPEALWLSSWPQLLQACLRFYGLPIFIHQWDHCIPLCRPPLPSY